MARPLAHNLALDCAFALARTPALAAGMRSQALPGDVKVLLSVVAREAGALDHAVRFSGMSGDDILAAAELYVQQVMLHPKADSRRALGIGLDCDRNTARAHMRLLMTWLHPDRNENAWRSAFAHRVLAAWRDVSRASPYGSANLSDLGVSEASRSGRAKVPGARAAAAQVDGRLPWVPRPLPHRKSVGFVSSPNAMNQRPVRLALASTMMLLASTLPAETAGRDMEPGARDRQMLCAHEASLHEAFP